jgi:membrane protein
VIVAPIALQMIGMGSQTELLIKFGRWPALALFAALGAGHLVPLCAKSALTQMALDFGVQRCGTLIWMVASGLLSYYLSNFGHYDATYGSLGAAIALMIWMWMSIVFLFGAELNSEIEHQTIADSTTGPPKPLGDRGASTADTVGARYPS